MIHTLALQAHTSWDTVTDLFTIMVTHISVTICTDFETAAEAAAKAEAEADSEAKPKPNINGLPVVPSYNFIVNLQHRFELFVYLFSLLC